MLTQTQPNFATFSKIYLATIWYDMSLSTWLDVSMATIFWQACFSKFQLLLFKRLNKSFLVAFFKSLDHFMVFLFVLITFEPILDGFLRIWTNPEIQDGRHSEMITQLLRHVTSSPHNADVKGDIFRHTIYPASLVVIVVGVTEGERNPPPGRKARSIGSINNWSQFIFLTF